MNSTTKRIIFLLVLPLLLSSCLIQNPKPEDCEVKEITVVKIYEGGVKDIVFAEESGDFYYINRGLEQGFTLAGMEEQVLNKKVTLHLAKVITGTSNHIAQLAVEDDVIFTEFK
jgi:hypothetical protein